MTDKRIYQLLGETSNYEDPDAFASDAVLSLLDPDNPDQDMDMDAFEQLRTLWHVSRDPFRALLDGMGMTQTQCSCRFCIPLRTVQDWAGERRTPPLYVRLMMAEATGLLDIRDNQPSFIKNFEFDGLTGTLVIEDQTPNRYGNIAAHFTWGEIDEYPTFRSLEQAEAFIGSVDSLEDYIDQSARST